MTTKDEITGLKLDVPGLEVETAAKIIGQLMGGSERMRLAVTGLLAARQMYAFSMHEVAYICRQEELLKEVGVNAALSESQQLLVQEIVSQSIAARASQPFDEGDLFSALTERLFPWMQSIVKDHQIEQAKIRLQAKEKEEAERVATPVNIGIPIGAPNVYGLSRDKSVVLVGKQDALMCLLDMISGTLSQQRRPENGINQVVRLSSHEMVDTDDRSAWSNGIAASKWHGSMETSKAWNNMLSLYVEPYLTAKPDVLIVDHLTKLASTLFTSSHVGTNVNEMHRRLVRWMPFDGCLRLLAEPIPVTLTQSQLQLEFKSLIPHAHVLSVYLQADPHDEKTYHLMVGNFIVGNIVKPENDPETAVDVEPVQT